MSWRSVCSTSPVCCAASGPAQHINLVSISKPIWSYGIEDLPGLGKTRIARALALNPKVIALDEPVSALDVSIRAQILNILVDLQEEHGLAYVMVAHNLATVRYMCHQTAVMYLGVVQEMGDTEKIFQRPTHLYTNALISAALPSHPDIQRDEIVLPGEVVSPLSAAGAPCWWRPPSSPSWW